VGIHGFERGGFLIEGGKAAPEAISPLVARANFPAQWPVVLFLPPWGKGQSGESEARAFQKLLESPPAKHETDRLCRLVLLEILPALAEGDLADFGAALHEFNERAGAAFAEFQAGPYVCQAVAELIAFLEKQGLVGVGQSSWGPGVFGFSDDEERAQALAEAARERFGGRPKLVGAGRFRLQR
jgi:beta-RFAP synthase